MMKVSDVDDAKAMKKARQMLRRGHVESDDDSEDVSKNEKMLREAAMAASAGGKRKKSKMSPDGDIVVNESDQEELGEETGSEFDQDEAEIQQQQIAIKHAEATMPPSAINTETDVIDGDGIAAAVARLQYKVPKGLTRVPWLDTLSLTASKSAEDMALSPGEDIRREVVMYNLTLENVLEGLRRFKAMGVPFCRPKDFFAEMFKNDNHMRKVRAHILDQQKAMSIVASRRKSAVDKKFNRAVSFEKKKFKAQAQLKAKRDIEDLKKQEGKKRHPASRSEATSTVNKSDDLFVFSGTERQSKGRRGGAQGSEESSRGGRRSRQYLRSLNTGGGGINIDAAEGHLPRSFRKRGRGGHQIVTDRGGQNQRGGRAKPPGTRAKNKMREGNKRRRR